MNRFFIPPEAIQGDTITIPRVVSDQIRKVLRLKNGESVTFLDNYGNAYLTRLGYQSEKEINGTILHKEIASGEPETKLTLLIALTQREKFELILQKSTEAGVSRIIPMVTERTLIRRTDSEAKLPRWRKILQEAAEQCARGAIPEIVEPIPFSKAIHQSPEVKSRLIFLPGDDSLTLREVFGTSRPCSSQVLLTVGPEGGFSEPEVSEALLAGWQPTTLGKRVFRMETAAIAAAILTLYELER